MLSRHIRTFKRLSDDTIGFRRFLLWVLGAERSSMKRQRAKRASKGFFRFPATLLNLGTFEWLQSNGW